MPFFEDVPEPPGWRPKPIEPRRRRWRGTPDDTLGAGVDLSTVVVRTEEIAILVSAIVAFPIGFSFSVVALSRTGAAEMSMWRHPRHGPGQGDALQFGVQFSDGSKATNQHDFAFVPHDDDHPRLIHHGAGGGGRRFSARYTCYPLPPSGPLLFVAAWPDKGIGETSVEVDGDLIRQPGLAAPPLWPDDVDYEEVGVDPLGGPGGLDPLSWPNGGSGTMTLIGRSSDPTTD
jgi:hypothetical protein